MQPQIRYAPTTSQTKRLSAPAHVPHGKPSAEAACPTSSAGLGEPAEPDAPGRQPAGEAGAAELAGVGEGGLPVGEQRRDDEQLSHRRSRFRASSASSAVSRSSRASFAAMITT